MALSDEAVEDLRASLKATRRRLEESREAVEENTVQLLRFNDNIEDALEALQQMMPLIEGAAAGSSALKMGVGMFKALMEKRRTRKKRGATG